MSDIHLLGAHSPHSKELAEKVDAKFVEQGIIRAREKTIEVVELIRKEIRVGMGEDECRKLALSLFADHGVKKHWHRPYIRFGKNTALTFNDPVDTEIRVEENTSFYIDVGPAWPDAELGLEYEGDYGDTFLIGENPEAEKCAKTARVLFEEAKAAWKAQELSGEALYAFLRKRALEEGYDLDSGVNGHRISDFPHQRHAKGNLAERVFVPSRNLWVLEVMLLDRKREFGAFFEDIL